MIFAVIVAGGKGLRMGTAIPKQFLLLHGEPVLVHTLRIFYQAFPGIQIRLVLPADAFETAIELLQPLQKKEPELILVPGGETRFHSVKNGLEAIQEEGWVLVHDAVRPLVSEAFLQYCLAEAKDKGNAVPVVPVKDSMRLLTNTGNQVLDREKVMAVQTPQVFQVRALQTAFQQVYTPTFTDEASVYEANGSPIHLVQGLLQNIKITTPEDFILAEQWLKRQ